MADGGSDEKTAEAGTAATSGVRPDRRARLAALRARRPAATEPAAGAQPQHPRLTLAQRAGGRFGQGEGVGGALQVRKQVMMRVYKLLTRTPDDGSGMVAGTPFTKAGVAELMTMLHERAANEGAPGAKMAGNAIGFLRAADPDEEVVAGASVAKLQQVARIAAQFGTLG